MDIMEKYTIQTSKNRLTGSQITVAKPWHFLMEDHEDFNWVTSCDTHGRWVGSITKRLAQLSGTYPDFCDTCQDILIENGVK